MADLDLTIRCTGTLQTFNGTTGSSNKPDNLLLEFTTQKRVVERVVEIAANGSITVTKATEGLTTAHLLKIECLTANKSLNLKFNADPNGFQINPVLSTETAFFLATADFTTVQITNLDVSNPVFVQVSAYEKKP